MSGKCSQLYLERKAYFAEHPWGYFVKEEAKGPPRFNNGLIKPSIRRDV